MPRFVAKPVIVEAHCYNGHTLNLDGAFNAIILNYVSGGKAKIRTPDGFATLTPGDWLVCGPTGTIQAMSAAMFEAMFAPAAAPAPVVVTVPATIPVKRAYTRRIAKNV